MIAKEFGQRPSALLRGSWLDYQIDAAVLLIGTQDPKKAKPQPGMTNAPITKDGLADGSALARWGVIPTMSIQEGELW